MPPGVDFVRATVADPRGGVVRIATDADPSVVVAVDDETLRVVDVVVLPRPARHVRAGASPRTDDTPTGSRTISRP